MAKTKSITSEFTQQELWQLGCVVLRRIKDEEKLLETNNMFGRPSDGVVFFLNQLRSISVKISQQIVDRQEDGEFVEFRRLR